MTLGKEYAAGGVVGRGGKVLLVKVCNLQGEIVWTFPKGHLEKGETPLKAALREVEEETGFRCRNLGMLAEVRYRFQRNGRPVVKKVRWYRMAPVEKIGGPDPLEIKAIKWVGAKNARRELSYPSDLRLIARYLRAQTV